MNKKRFVIFGVIVIILGVILSGVYYFLTKEDEVSTLNIIEKQWIEDNKNNIIDLSIINNMPIFNYEGEGVLFDFVESIEEDTGLEFNKLSYEYGDSVSTDYSFSLVDEVQDNGILIYEDNYAILTSENVKYNNLFDIPEATIGVLASDLEKVNYYLKENTKLSFKTYENTKDLFAAIAKNDKGTSEVQAIVLPKTIYLEDIVSNNLNISYNISELSKKLVLQLGDTKKLNTIIKKYYKKWYNNSYSKSYNTNFSNNYYEFYAVDDDSKINFLSRTYQYSFINNAPYDKVVNNSLAGYNNEVIKEFAKLSGVEIAYTQYGSFGKLLEAFNSNKSDIFFNISANEKYSMDVYNTVSAYENNIAIASNIEQNVIVNSVASLKGKTVLVIKDSKIASYLKENSIEIKEYDNISSFLNGISDSSIIAIDLESYNIYSHNKLSDYRIDYTFTIDSDYNFVIRDIKSNKVFSNFFNFYLSFINQKEYSNVINYKTFNESVKTTLKNGFIYIMLLFIASLIAFITLKLKKVKKNKNKKVNSMSKENKLRYIDMLTCLKNRNFLNDSIEKWDESEIYPQAIVVIDLNNVAYINDNYGHEEGDNVIREAANILIKSQIEKSEIMRTNGNEFLIYLVEYEEKQVVSYIRKLSKEFKDLAHGFGAAIGYSMITDPIKTVDDAINEATLDMRNNKEEANN